MANVGSQRMMSLRDAVVMTSLRVEKLEKNQQNVGTNVGTNVETNVETNHKLSQLELKTTQLEQQYVNLNLAVQHLQTVGKQYTELEGKLTQLQKKYDLLESHVSNNTKNNVTLTVNE